MWGQSELLCPATMAKAWGWTDLPVGSRSPRISPLWLLVPLPEITPSAPAAPGDGKEGVPKVGMSWPGAPLGLAPGRVQRTVSLVIVIRVILQQLESCFCAGVAWLYRSEGGERNTGNGSDGSRIISWRERRAADATEGNKDGDSEGLMHGLAL